MTIWDANGNLAQMIGCKLNSGRLHEWDEENRLRFVLGERFAGYYGYDANGERVYKLIGISSIDQVNSGSTKAQAIFDDAVLYPNPYMVVTQRGYTKHYYAGTERLATVIGGGGLGDMVTPMDKFSTQREWVIVDALNKHYQTNDPFLHGKLLSGPTPTEDIDHKQNPDLDYQCKPVFLDYVDVLTKTDILFEAIDKNTKVNSKEDEIYFYHGDHLGSANWITDIKGDAIQYIHYAPYGEMVDNQQASAYNERFKFTGKERDRESGYDYFGARYYSSSFSHWLSVDPLADKYPYISPYAYCNWNPIKYVDPNGKWLETAWDIANVAMDAVSLESNIKDGNFGAAMIDGVGLVLDLGAAILPIVPGGAGTAIKAYRTADKVVDASKVSKQGQQVKSIGGLIKPNSGTAKPHGGTKHNAAIDKYIDNLPKEATNIRKNQTQVDVNGNKVGNNRPDIQYDISNQHVNVEFDTKPSNGDKHQRMIKKNDPNAKVILKTIE